MIKVRVEKKGAKETEENPSLAHRTVRCATGQSDDPPDSLVKYSGAAVQKPEGEEFSLYGPWCTGHCLVAHRTVRSALPGFSSISFAPFF